MSGKPPACRLYVLVARNAPTAVVIRRGPTDWWHLLRWDLNKLTLTPGAWFNGNLYPRRADISPDGRLLGYFAMKVTAGSPNWPSTYFAVSKLPWLKALAAWETCGTWTWGCEFTTSGKLEVQAAMGNEPFHGSYPGDFSVVGMSTEWLKRDVWNELKRGWRIAEASDPLLADKSGTPNLVLRRDQPSGSTILRLIHQGVDFSRGGMEGVQLEYFLQSKADDVTPLDQVAWADWDQEGRLLIATCDGKLEVFRCNGNHIEKLWSEGLCDLTPNPQPAPDSATHW